MLLTAKCDTDEKLKSSMLIKRCNTSSADVAIASCDTCFEKLLQIFHRIEIPIFARVIFNVSINIDSLRDDQIADRP